MFKDSAGRSYNIKINIGAIRRVRDLLDLDLSSPWTAYNDSKTLLEALSSDFILQVDVCYAILKPQADSYELTDEEFGESVDGKVFSQMMGMFWESYQSFFQSTGRIDLAKSAQKMSQVAIKAVQEIAQRVEAVDVDKVIQSQFGESSTSTPGS